MPVHSFANYVCQFGAGAVGAPSVYFSTDTTTGLYRSAANEVCVTVSGTAVCTFKAGCVMVPAGSAATCAVNFGTAGTGLYGTSTAVSIATAGSNRATVDSAGLAVAGAITAMASGASASFRTTTYRDSANQCTYAWYNARGSSASPANLQSGDGNGTLQAYAFKTGTTFAPNGAARFIATENHSATALGCKFQVYVTANAATSQTLGFEIDQDLSCTIKGAINHDGSAVGFYGTAPQTQVTITGARNNPEGALKNALAALAAIGLFKDSTTAS